MPDFSAAREVLRCVICRQTMLVLTVEAPQPAATCAAMLSTLVEAFQMRAMLQCDACMIRQQIEEAPADV